MILVHFQGKPFNIRVIQDCVPITDAEEAEVDWVYEALKDFSRTNTREFQKNIYFCFIDYAKAFDCVDHNYGKFLKRREYHTTCPAS